MTAEAEPKFRRIRRSASKPTLNLVTKGVKAECLRMPCELLLRDVRAIP